MVLDHFFPALHSLSSQLLVHTHLAHFYQLALHHLTVVHLHWLLDFDYPEQLLLVFHFQFHHRSDLHSLVYQYLVDSSYYFANHYPNDGKIYVNPIENHPDSKNLDRKSTRLNSSHVAISYAVFCLKKKNNKQNVSILSKKH